MSAAQESRYVTPPLRFPSAPPDANTRATVQLVANDHRADRDWAAFERACRMAAVEGIVDPNHVRTMTREWGLEIPPRRYSAFWNRAAAKAGFLDFSHWGVNEDTKGKNAGKPARIYKLRTKPTPSNPSGDSNVHPSNPV